MTSSGKTLNFSENVIEEVSVAEDPLLMFMKIIQVTLLGQILEIVCRNRFKADKKTLQKRSFEILV